MTLPSNTDNIFLTNNSNVAKFKLSDFEAVDSAGNNASTTIRTDGTGAATLFVGATLNTDATTPSSNYSSTGDVLFTGTYNIDISY